MAAASESAELAALEEALQRRDVVAIARLTRDARSAAEAEAGCNALRVLAVTDGYPPTTEETQRAVEALLSALHAHPASAGVQMLGFDGIGRWCHKGEGRMVAVAGGAVEAAAIALRAHADNVAVLRKVCFALANLSDSASETFEGDGEWKIFHRAGVLDPLLDVMRAHSSHADVQTSGCLMLGNICGRVACVTAAALRLGAPAVIISALQSFPDDDFLQSNACYAHAGVLPSEPTAENDAQLPGAVSCIIHTLRAHLADEDVQLRACLVLKLLTKNQPMSAVEAWRRGAFPLIMSSLEVHKKHPAVLQQCFAAAHELIPRVNAAGLARILTPADAEAAVSAVVAAMDAFPAHASLHSVACGFVSKLASCDPSLAAGRCSLFWRAPRLAWMRFQRTASRRLLTPRRARTRRMRSCKAESEPSAHCWRT